MGSSPSILRADFPEKNLQPVATKVPGLTRSCLSDRFEHIFIYTSFLSFLHIHDFLYFIKLLSKWSSKLFGKHEATTWYYACLTLASSRGLYLPVERSGPVKSWKKVFHANLWPTRHKWSIEATNPDSFKIDVCARFRPGKKSDSKVSLPLHQFLKMRRASKSAMPSLSSSVEELDVWKDGMSGKIMNDPVQLPGSKKYMDRPNIIRCLRFRQQDPFDGSYLRPDMLRACPAISKQIKIYKTKTEQTPKDMRVSMSAVTKIAEAGEVLDSDLVDALMEAERLSRATEQAERKIREEMQKSRRHSGDSRLVDVGDFSDVAVPEVDEEIVEDDTTASIHTLNEVKREEIVSKQSKTNEVKDWNVTASFMHKELPRVIGVQPNRVNMFVPGAGVRPFTFSKCYNGNISQSTVYLETGRHVVMAALNGLNSALLTYGQTGSGKTFTVFGPEDWERTTLKEIHSGKPLSVCGVAVRAMNDIFDSKKFKEREIRMNVSCQYVQIYNEKVFDLTSGKQVRLIKSNGRLVGASSTFVENIEEFFHILHTGEQFKHYAETAMNHRSSRAHTVLLVSLSQTKIGTDLLINSQLQIVDLAGSERIKKSKVVGQKRTESVGINKSLMCLGKVIKNLVEEKSHIPYFESSLTTLLKSAFGGNSITSAIVTCRSDDAHASETLQALYFGERCSMISNVTRNAVTSRESALEAIDVAIKKCDHGIQRLRLSGKEALKVYEELVNRRDNLSIKRRGLLHSC